MATITDAKKDVAFALAKNITGAHYEDIPVEVREATKYHILDTLGVMIGGSKLVPGVKEVVALVSEWGGKPESTILGYGIKVPAWAAAFANGAMAHGLDYDNVRQDTLIHPSAPIVSAAFAAAERVRKVSGKDFLTAMVLAQDLICRLALSITRRPRGWKQDWHTTPVFGAFAAAAAAGRLLELDENGMVSNFGIALTMAAGTMELCYGTESELRLIYDGFPAKAGILAALMAQKGVSGVRNTFEGQAALYNVYFEGDYNRTALLADLGKKFEGGKDIGTKPWPACGGTHMYIDATLQIVREHNLHPDDIESVTAIVGDFCQNLCQPLEARQKPQTVNDAKYSIPFCIGLAIARRKVVIGDFTFEGIKDPAVLNIAQKVTPRFNLEFTMVHRMATGAVEIKTQKGEVYSRRVDFAYGDAANPMSTADIIDKFRDCVLYSAKPITKGKVEEVIKLVSGLENIEDATEIIRLLT